MKITIAICTWNRSRLLQRTLESMCGLAAPAGIEWELIVVNNNSTDSTDDVIRLFQNRLPIRGLFEKTPGKSNAANLAIKNSAGDYIIWTDDDVTVDNDWLAVYVKAFETWPTAEYFGGAILPGFEAAPPPWIQQNLKHFGGLLGVRDLGPEERPLTASERPFGANMAFRRSVFDKWGFDPRLGPQGGDRLTHEETVLLEQLRCSGAIGVWVPAARVWHYIPKERLTKSQIWNIYYTMGKSEVIVRGVPPGKILFRVPRFLYGQFWQLKGRYYMQGILRNPLWAVTYARLAEVCGTIDQSRKLYDEQHSSPILSDLRI
jgi:glucosyl-dolichyl phosphate glucuronosyltransferase